MLRHVSKVVSSDSLDDFDNFDNFDDFDDRDSEHQDFNGLSQFGAPMVTPEPLLSAKENRALRREILNEKRKPKVDVEKVTRLTQQWFNRNAMEVTPYKLIQHKNRMSAEKSRLRKVQQIDILKMENKRLALELGIPSDSEEENKINQLFRNPQGRFFSETRKESNHRTARQSRERQDILLNFLKQRNDQLHLFFLFPAIINESLPVKQSEAAVEPGQNHTLLTS